MNFEKFLNKSRICDTIAKNAVSGGRAMAHMTDIDIAQSTEMLRIRDIAAELGIDE